MKRRLVLGCLFAPFLLAVGPKLLLAQNPADAAPPKPPRPQFFAGVVIEADAEHVKVSRDLVGQPPETHVFALNGKTKTPKGGVKLKSRVTVRYEHWPERDLALEIQVRALNHSPKTT